MSANRRCPRCGAKLKIAGTLCEDCFVAHSTVGVNSARYLNQREERERQKQSRQTRRRKKS
jgi:hypothetical protein